MEKREGILIKLNAEKRVYEDSPGVTVTYKDLARLIEHIIDITQTNNKIGFKKNG